MVPSYLWFHHIHGSTFTDSAYHGLFSAAVFTVEKYLHVKEPAATAKSLQSCLTLCDLETAAHQAPPSLGFSRREHWSGLPFPSPMHESEVAQLCPTLCEPMDCSLPGSSVHEIFQARVLEWVAIAFSGKGTYAVPNHCSRFTCTFFACSALIWLWSCQGTNAGLL